VPVVGAAAAAANVEGGLILGRVLKDVTILPRQIMLYRELVRATFLPESR
jgi:TetR/AcrR family transcriptional regulator, transcriptional repressor for nem operon